MIYNEETYCVVYHKIVREIGAWEAIVFGTIVGLLRKTDGIGEVSNQQLMDLCGINNKMSLFRYINKLIEAEYIEKREGKGRGNISIYYVTKKGNNLLPFSEKKGNKNDIKKVTKMNEKGNNLLPINKDNNKEINKEYLSSFEVQSPSNDEREDGHILEEKILNGEIDLFRENDNSDFEENVKVSFNEFWKLFAPIEKEKCKYKKALGEWNAMSQEWREACIKMLEKCGKPAEQNPYFYLQHFAPLFLNERQQYEAWKVGVQLCRVRYKDKQPICSAWMAEIFKLQVLDDHYEKRFEQSR